MEFYYIIAIVVGIILLLCLIKYICNGPASPIKRNLSRKVILITGASGGIGKEAAIELLDQGATVICASRSKERSIAVINKSKKPENGVFYSLDLSSFQSTIEFAEKIKKDFPNGIDILINNAGQAFSNAELTNDGIEKSIQTNHLGHFILTALLIEKFIKSNGKIINVSSRGHKRTKLSTIENLEKDFDFAKLKNYYEIFDFYCFTKLANVIHSKFLAKNFPQITSASLHPGVVYSDIWDKTEGVFKCIINCLKPFSYIFMKNEKMGAQTTVYLAYEDNENITNGGYYKDCAELEPEGIVHNQGMDKRVMNYTKNLIEKYFTNLPEELRKHLEIIDKMTY